VGKFFSFGTQSRVLGIAGGSGAEKNQNPASGFSSKKVRTSIKKHRQVLHSAKLKDVVPELETQEKIVVGVKTIYNETRNLRQEAESVIAEAQKQMAEMIFT